MDCRNQSGNDRGEQRGTPSRLRGLFGPKVPGGEESAGSARLKFAKGALGGASLAAS